MSRKAVGFLLCFCLVAGILGGCGSENTAGSNSEETASFVDGADRTNDGASDEMSDVDTADPTPEMTSEPVETPFMEENGISMGGLTWSDSDDLFYSVLFAYYLGESGEIMTEADGFEISNGGMLESFFPYPIVLKSEQDADGNTTYTISLYYSFAVDVSTPSFDDVIQNLHIEYRNWGLFDYYTGTYLSPEENSSDQLDIIWGDATYPIHSAQTAELDWFHWEHFEPSGSEMYDVTNDYYQNLWMGYGSLYLEYEVTVPSDYDGLVLFCKKPEDDIAEVFEYMMDNSIENKMDYVRGYDSNFVFGSDVKIEDSENYTFLPVSSIAYEY